MFGVSRVTHGFFLTLFAGLVLSPTGHGQSALSMNAAAGVPFDVNVRSIHEIRYNHIVSQRYDYSCGSAALATLLKYGSRIPSPESAMIPRMIVFSTPEVVVKNGFSMPYM